MIMVNHTSDAALCVYELIQDFVCYFKKNCYRLDLDFCCENEMDWNAVDSKLQSTCFSLCLVSFKRN